VFFTRTIVRLYFNFKPCKIVGKWYISRLKAASWRRFAFRLYGICAFSCLILPSVTIRVAIHRLALLFPQALIDRALSRAAAEIEKDLFRRNVLIFRSTGRAPRRSVAPRCSVRALRVPKGPSVVVAPRGRHVRLPLLRILLLQIGRTPFTSAVFTQGGRREQHYTVL
jgi:hypothetical protein